MWRPHDIVCAMIAFSGALIIANESVWAAGDALPFRLRLGDPRTEPGPDPIDDAEKPDLWL